MFNDSSTKNRSAIGCQKKLSINVKIVMHTYRLCLRESNTVVRCPLMKFIPTKLQLTFNDTHVLRSVGNLKIIDL